MRELVANTGYTELSLVSLSSTDHSQIGDIVRAIRADFGDELTISLPSTRVDSFSVDIALLCSARKKHSMTFAPEAGLIHSIYNHHHIKIRKQISCGRNR